MVQMCMCVLGWVDYVYYYSRDQWEKVPHTTFITILHHRMIYNVS